MNRQAFKQRMQNLKSYRENNPGKGYWDWKVEAFADGGQTGDPEKKSIMNQFDEYLMNTLTPSTYPTNTKQFRQVIESAPDLYNNMKMLLKIHTKPSVLYKDFLARPLVNKISKNKNQEIV